MEKVYQLADKLITLINEYCEKYTSNDGKIIRTEASIGELNRIVEGGFSLYKYLIDKKIYETIPKLTSELDELSGYICKLQMNKENAQKLHLTDALQIWEQCKIVIAYICNDILDYRDEQDKK